MIDKSSKSCYRRITSNLLADLINYFFLVGVFLLIKLVKPEIVLHYAYDMEHILSNFYIIMDPFNIYILIAFYIIT